MDKPGTVDEVLDYAIERESEAAKFYADLAGRSEWQWMQSTFLEFSREEAAHKAKLLAIKQGRLLMPSAQRVTDLRIADHLIEVAPHNKLTYKQALMLAMQREKASFRLYTDLASATENAGLRTTFQVLALEEAKHKLRFELEYDNEILTEN
jgi:rubrerythrin